MKTKRGWNISNENLKEIFIFIDNFKPKNEIEKRNLKILKYAFEKNMTALQISKLKDKDIICYSNRAKGKYLSNAEISRIIRDYDLIHKKRIDYSLRNNYKRRKELNKKIQNRQIKKPKICGCCGCEKELQLHHIIPISKGGNDEYYNLLYLCRKCHRLIHKEILDRSD